MLRVVALNLIGYCSSDVRINGLEPVMHRVLPETIPDARDGLTRTERIILYVLREAQRERNGRNVPTAMLYGRVVEYVNLTEAELYDYLDRLGVRGE